MVNSAQVASSTPGVRPTRTPRRVASATSTLSRPVAMLLTTTRPGAPSISGPSTRSETMVSRASRPAERASNSSRGGGNHPSQTSMSVCCARRSRLPWSMRRVTNTFGRAMASPLVVECTHCTRPSGRRWGLLRPSKGPPAHPRTFSGGTSPRAARRPRGRGDPSGLPRMRS